MRTNKTLLIGIIAIIAIVALGWWLSPMFTKDSGPVDTTARFSSSSLGLAFDYSKTYTLDSRDDAFEQEPITVMTLLPTGAVVPDMSEGPAGISILVIPNPSGTPLTNWVRAKSISNFALAADPTLATSTVGGEPAIAYTYSGLYENDAVAVAHAGKIYLFFGAWGAAEDPIRAEFQNLLQTVTFR